MRREKNTAAKQWAEVGWTELAFSSEGSGKSGRVASGLGRTRLLTNARVFAER